MSARQPRLKLISHDLCPYVQRALIVLHHKGVAHQREYIDLADKPEWFTRLSPLGKVPLLLVDGQPLFESSPIVQYLDETTAPALLPQDAFARARHRAWIEMASSTLDAIAGLYSAADLAALAAATQRLQARLQALERELAGRSDPQAAWFDGAFGLVDASYGPVFRYFESLDALLDGELWEELPHTLAWRRSLAEHPAVQAGAHPEYAVRLRRFLQARQSLIAERAREHWQAAA